MSSSYNIDRDASHSMRPTFTGMIRGIRDSRGLAWQLFLRNLKSQYRQTFLGYLWLILPTAAVTLLWLFLHAQSVATYRGEVPYALFLLIGMLWWQLFADSVQAPLKIVAASQAMLLQVNFPRESLIMAGLLEALFSFAVRLSVTLVLVLGVGWSINPSWNQIVVGGATIVTMGTAIGVLLVPIGMLYKDIDRSLTILLQFWMYLTPVVYEVPGSKLGQWLVAVNPVAVPLTAARDGFLGGQTEQWFVLGTWFLLFLVLIFLGWVIYRVSMPIIIERMTG